MVENHDVVHISLVSSVRAVFESRKQLSSVMALIRLVAVAAKKERSSVVIMDEDGGRHQRWNGKIDNNLSHSTHYQVQVTFKSDPTNVDFIYIPRRWCIRESHKASSS